MLTKDFLKDAPTDIRIPLVCDWLLVMERLDAYCSTCRIFSRMKRCRRPPAKHGSTYIMEFQLDLSRVAHVQPISPSNCLTFKRLFFRFHDAFMLSSPFSPSSSSSLQFP